MDYKPDGTPTGGPRLTPTSYIVLGLVDAVGEATPYELKRIVAAGVGNFWSLQHAQLYTETTRLAAGGYLEETREDRGRRRKLYRLTDRGRAALRDWVTTPTREFTELRDLALLKLFFGADPASLAREQLEVHEAKLGEYERLRSQLAGASAPEGPRLTLESGIGHEREWVRFWSRLASRRAPAHRSSRRAGRGR
jgi:DNA-binding PadR family transcriptional regulator